MDVFANGFKLANKNDGDEFIIRFHQNSPSFNELGSVTGVISEPVASLVMPKNVALLLSDMIKNMLGTPEEEPETPVQ